MGKVVASKGRKALLREPSFRGSPNHVAVMPAASADGKAWNPVVALPGTLGRWRKASDGSI